MTQSTDLTLADQVGADFRIELNSILQALGSTHKGAAAPSYLVTGMLWIDDTATPWILKIYDGAGWISVLDINATTNAINISAGVDIRAAGAGGIIIKNSGGSTVATFGASSGTTTVLVGLLTLVGSISVAGTASAPASISLAEDTDNGTNTTTITAPSSIASNRTLTAPDASGTIATQEWVSASVTLDALYPIGTLYMNKTDSTNPATLFGFGTWTAITDKMIMAVGSTYGVGTSGGAASQTISEANLPSSLTVSAGFGDSGTGNYLRSSGLNNEGTKAVALSSVGSGTAIATLPPYVTAYIWERTA